jgi:hypothetical protein
MPYDQVLLILRNNRSLVTAEWLVLECLFDVRLSTESED